MLPRNVFAPSSSLPRVRCSITSSSKQDTRERAPEIVGYDSEQVVPRPYRPLLAQVASRDVDFDGTAPQVVRGFEAARRPRMRTEPHLLSPERKRLTRTQAIAGLRRDRLSWIAGPAHRLDELRAEPQESPLRSTGQSEREQPAGDVAGLLRPQGTGRPATPWRTAGTLPSRRPTPRCPE